MNESQRDFSSFFFLFISNESKLHLPCRSQSAAAGMSCLSLCVNKRQMNLNRLIKIYTYVKHRMAEMFINVTSHSENDFYGWI